MKQIDEVNRWYEEKCDLIESEQVAYLFFKNVYGEVGKNSGFTRKTWTIEDAHVREICRERWLKEKIGRTVTFTWEGVHYCDPDELKLFKANEFDVLVAIYEDRDNG